MKTSNKLLLTAILIIIVSMVTYDFALRAEYRKGTYKSRFYSFEKLNFKDFNKIDNRVANYVTILLEQNAKYNVSIRKELKNQVKIFKRGNSLVIDVLDKKSLRYNGVENSIVISCPSLEEVVTTPFFKENKSEDINYDTYGSTTLIGFNQQNLNLLINNSTNITLVNSKIENLKAAVGNSLTKHASLTLALDNQFNTATIVVAGTNSLNIQNNAKIGKPNFIISDSAKVNLNGIFFNHIKKEKL